jgi:sigma-B regulation protein RsbU (phosphoserine phosphatase)
VLIVTTSGMWAILIARVRVQNDRRLAHVTRIAELTQHAIVRPLPPRIGGTCLAVYTRSATRDALVGGDLHDAVLTPSGMRLMIGDVKGHGIAAAHQAAAVLAAFRHTAAAEPDLARLARVIDARIRPDLEPEDFVTLLLADFTAGEVRLVSCGHPPPLHVGRRLRLLQPPRPSRPLGLSPDPQPYRVRLAPTQRLLFYTDGLTEARGHDGDTLFLTRTLHNALTALTLDQALDRLLGLMHWHDRETAGDDVTVILTQPAIPTRPVTRSDTNRRQPWPPTPDR